TVKLQLIMFFEGLRSERELNRIAADRLSVRWYLGYDLDEELPEHSSLTRIRHRYCLAMFRRFFEAIVEQWLRADGGRPFSGLDREAGISSPGLAALRMRNRTTSAFNRWRGAYPDDMDGSIFSDG